MSCTLFVSLPASPTPLLALDGLADAGRSLLALLVVEVSQHGSGDGAEDEEVVYIWIYRSATYIRHFLLVAA